MDKKPIIYFANPYRHKNPNIMLYRFQTMRAITAQIIQEQNYIIPFTPVVYTHDLSQYCTDGKSLKGFKRKSNTVKKIRFLLCISMLRRYIHS